MKVKELRELLAELPDDADCLFYMRAGCCTDLEELDFSEAFKWPGNLEFIFNPVPGYETCCLAGETRERSEEWMEEQDED